MPAYVLFSLKFVPVFAGEPAYCVRMKQKTDHPSVTFFRNAHAGAPLRAYGNGSNPENF
jgi:hypothetical protein